MRKVNQSGFHVLFILLALLVIGAVGFASYTVFKKQKDDQPGSKYTASSSGLVSDMKLECVPRGHDNYRTNQTLILDPQDADTMYIGVELKGVYKTTDGGKNWQQSDNGIRGYAREGDPSQKCVQELGTGLIDPSNSKHLLMSRVESPGDDKTLFSENAGLWESNDGGSSWHQLLKSGMNFSGSRAVAFAPDNSKTIYIGANNGHPSYTDSNGNSPQTYFNTKGILYKTSNGGKNWQELPTGADKGFRASGIGISAKDPKLIWLFTLSQDQDSGGMAADSAQKAAMKSTDGGQTWVSYADKLPAGYRTLSFGAMNPADSNNVVIATQTTSGPQKSFVTTNGGDTWQATNQPVYVFSYDTNDASGKRLVGYDPFSPGGGIYESLDKGVSWSRLSDVPNGVDNSDNFGVRIENFAFSPAAKGTIYATGSNANIWKSTDDGKTWQSIMTIDSIGGLNKNKDGNTHSREQDPGAH